VHSGHDPHSRESRILQVKSSVCADERTILVNILAGTNRRPAPMPQRR